MPEIIISLVVTALLSYLWGSIPSGYWMGKLLRGRDFDIREHGSRRIGATNVQRTLGTFPAIIVLILDLSKGIVPALCATYIPFFQGAGWGILVAGLGALLGHCYPIFINFKGGRGVLTGSGIVLMVAPIIFLIGFIITIPTIIISRYVSLGSIIGALTILLSGVIFYFIGINQPDFLFKVTLPQMLYMVIASSLVILLHLDNIKRLLAGTERKLGKPSTATS